MSIKPEDYEKFMKEASAHLTKVVEAEKPRKRRDIELLEDILTELRIMNHRLNNGSGWV